MSKKRRSVSNSIWGDYIFFMIFLAVFFLIFGGALLSSENFKIMAIVWAGVGVVFGIGSFMKVNSENKHYDEMEIDILKQEVEDLTQEVEHLKKD